MATYTVKRGDTLSAIALRTLGNAARWREIASINRIADPNLIFPGQVLQLPELVGPPVPPPITTMPVPPPGMPVPAAPVGLADIWERYRWPIIGGVAVIALMMMPKKRRRKRRRR